jgi:deferrochelatase/peroxidase EfeB
MPQPDILGRHGTYVGLRKYQSRVGAFNRFLHANGNTEEERELLAAKLVGRWRSGAPLTLAPVKDDPALGDDPRRNDDFNYANDPDGRQVPLGCHMRRMNPRDTSMYQLTDVKVRRIIRRSTYGAPYDPNATSEHDDEIARGIYFLFISAKAMATLEFCNKSGSTTATSWGSARSATIRSTFKRRGDIHDPQAAGQAPRARHRNLQRSSRRRIHGHAEPVGTHCEPRHRAEYA